MLFDEADSDLLKTWIVKKLEDVSDADSDVLADYVLALVKTDEPEAVARTSCVENLRDFLGDTSASFVDDIFAAIASRAYDPSRPAPKATAPTHQPPRRTSFEPPQAVNGSRKRLFHDWDRDDSQQGVLPVNEARERPVKQPRRGRGGFDQRGGQQQHQFQHPNEPQIPTPPPGMPPFDPNNPMASFLAMQQAMSMMQGLPTAPLGQGQASPRCRDYDTKGFCSRGASCPYEHGGDPFVVPTDNNEYDPRQATLLNVQPSRTGVMNSASAPRGRGAHRGRGTASRGGGRRAEFSQAGPNHDRSITTVVVEQIPEDRFDEDTVREFFSDFGNIEEITMRPYKRLATVKYDSYDSAKAAYESPKVIFDNRFVKVYWHRPDNELSQPNGYTQTSVPRRHQDTGMEDAEPQLDPEAVAKKQEDAQRRHEEQKRQREEAENQKQELDSKMKAIEAERQKMATMLARKAGNKAASPAAAPEVERGTAENEQTKALKDQLAKLEAEAQSLGIDPEAADNGYSASPYSYRGRGGFRGRPRGTGGYNPGFRGGWVANRGGAVKRLDNRSKTVAVTFSSGAFEDHDEELRQWLLFNGPETASINKHPSRKDVALVAFAERYMGENFMATASSPNFPFAGRIELSWYRAESTNGASDNDVKMEAPPGQVVEIMTHAKEDVYDVADDDDARDHWG